MIFKTSRLAVAFFGTAALLLPMAAVADLSSESPAIAVSIGATFEENGQTFYNDNAMPSSSTDLESLAVSVASGQHAAVANSAALVDSGSAANAGATNASDTDLDSTVSFEQNSFESDVNISDSEDFYPLPPCFMDPIFCGPYYN